MFTLFLPYETFAVSSDSQLHLVYPTLQRYHRDVLGDEMTESGELVRLLTSRSQHVSLSRLESLEVTKGTIVQSDPSAFSTIERLPLPPSDRICLEISQPLLQKYAGSPVFYQL